MLLLAVFFSDTAQRGTQGRLVMRLITMEILMPARFQLREGCMMSLRTAGGMSDGWSMLCGCGLVAHRSRASVGPCLPSFERKHKVSKMEFLRDGDHLVT